MTDTDEQHEHASCVVAGETGILIRGAAGSGKSALALSIVERLGSTGSFAGLVADDRVVLRRRHGRLIATSHAAISGQIEIRGLGIVSRLHERSAIVGIVVDRDDVGDRYPDEEALWTDIMGVRVARVAVGASGDATILVLHRWRHLLGVTFMTRK